MREVRKMLNEKPSRIKLALILVALGVLAASGWALAQRFFGMGEYPGGTLRVVYKIEHGGADYPPTIYTMTVKPDGDRFDITEVTESQDRPADAVGPGFGPAGAAAAVRARFEEAGGHIDMSPLSVIDEREIELEPNQSYLLPDGAILKTGDRTKIAGIEVIMAIYTHPNYPTQRVQMALVVDKELAKLLVFPPLLVTELEGEMVSRTELVEFSHTR
jgi:hypothetical protein